jgi:dsDNA-binding SOS-regulon protein
MDYSRAQTAIAMAKVDAWSMRSFLENRSRQLRREADEIDHMLETATNEVDSWYDCIKRESDQERRASVTAGERDV